MSFGCCLSTSSGIICDFRMSFREFLGPVVNRFTRQTLPNVNRKHFFMNILCIEFFCSQIYHNRTLILSSTPFKQGRLFYYWNQPLNMRILICYLDCNEAALFCYLLVHIGNLLYQLHLFSFYLWPIYWLSFAEWLQKICLTAIRLHSKFLVR
jgi:hypothetical protein